MVKEDEKIDTVTQMASGDVTLCPVCLAASIARQIRGYSKTNNDTHISAVQISSKLTHVMSTNMISALGDAVEAIGEDRFGIKNEEVSTHLIRSGVAMAMYLGKCPVYTIMLIGRWSSDAFLWYIRKQAMEFSQNVAKRMLTLQNYIHTPEINSRILPEDPWQSNNPHNAKTRRNVGGNAIQQARLPAFALYE
jgi:hypothetical protein